MSIKTEIMTVTPEWADEVLERHYKRIQEGKFAQRKMSASYAYRLAGDMTNGDWQTTASPIVLDEDGNLVDGQHRLEAVRIAKKKIQMSVSTGWPVGDKNGVQMIDVIDTGKPRTVANMLQLHGLSYANQMAACARAIMTVGWSGGSVGMTYSQAHWILEKLGAREWIDRIFKKCSSHRDLNGWLVGPLAYYYSVHPNKALEFSEAVFNMEAVKGTGPHALLLWMKNSKASGRGKDGRMKIKVACSALRSFHTGQEVQIIKPTIEAVEWLSNLNPKLREQIRKMAPRTR